MLPRYALTGWRLQCAYRLLSARIRDNAGHSPTQRYPTPCRHPAAGVTASVEAYWHSYPRPFRRTQQLRDIPAPELIGTGRQKFRFLISRMNELVAALTRHALSFENPVHCANRAVIPAFVEQRSVNRRRSTVLKSLLMKTCRTAPRSAESCARGMAAPACDPHATNEMIPAPGCGRTRVLK